MRKLFITLIFFITSTFGLFAQIIYPYTGYDNGYGINKTIKLSLSGGIRIVSDVGSLLINLQLSDISLLGGQSYNSNGYFTVRTVDVKNNVLGSMQQISNSTGIFQIKMSPQQINFSKDESIIPFSSTASSLIISYVEINPTDGKHYCMANWFFVTSNTIRQLINPGVIAGADTLCVNEVLGKVSSITEATINTQATVPSDVDINLFNNSNYYNWQDGTTGLEKDFGSTIATSSITNYRYSQWNYGPSFIGGVICQDNFKIISNRITKTVMDCAVFSPNIIGATNIVPNQTTSYSIAGQTGMRYAWTVTGGTILSGQGTKSISVLWDGSGLSQARVAGNSYSVSVVETNANDVSNTLSSAITLTTTGTTSAMQAAGISVFPNPCQNQVSVSMPESNVEVEYTIYTLRGEAMQSGRFVSSSTSNTLTNQLPAGMYQLVLSYQGQRVQTALSVTE